MALLESHHGHGPCPAPVSTTPRGCCPYLRVLRRDLQDERQAVVVEVFVEGQQRPVHPALNEVVRVLAKPDGLDPVDDLVIGPHQHICKKSKAMSQGSDRAHGRVGTWRCPGTLPHSPRLIPAQFFPGQLQHHVPKCQQQLASICQTER